MLTWSLRTFGEFEDSRGRGAADVQRVSSRPVASSAGPPPAPFARKTPSAVAVAPVASDGSAAPGPLIVTRSEAAPSARESAPSSERTVPRTWIVFPSYPAAFRFSSAMETGVSPRSGFP